jgi:CheY-like chemotaxis protein
MPGVLLVDDDPIFQTIVRRIFDMAGIGLTSVVDPSQALEAARAAKPDLVILDYLMPGLDGLQLFQNLQADPALSAVPVWICSSRTDEEFVSSTFELGVADLVAKPISAKAFEAKVKGFLRRRGPRATSSVAAMKRELEDASTNIQRMLPKLGGVAGLDIGVVYEPHAKVGGDFYDLIETRRGTRVVVIGDVSGHGVPAAVIQTMARKLIQLCLRHADSMEQGLLEANDELRKEIPGKSFVAALGAEWDPAARSVTFVRLGVPHPILRAAGGPGVPAPARLLLSGGAVMGMTPTDRLHRVISPLEVPLAPGDVLLLHTDGAVEAPLPGGEEFGFERLRETLSVAPCGSAQAVADACAAAVHAASGPKLDDDLTLIALSAVER